MPFLRNMVLASLCAFVWTPSPVAALCLESGEYEQAIADMEAREAARAKDAEVAGQTSSSPSTSPAAVDEPAEVAAAGNASVKPN